MGTMQVTERPKRIRIHKSKKKPRHEHRSLAIHLATDYSNSPGVLKVGLRDVRPEIDGMALMVRGIDADGFQTCISREEALDDSLIMSQEEIYQRAAEAREISEQPLFGNCGSHIARMDQGGPREFGIRVIPIRSVFNRPIGDE